MRSRNFLDRQRDRINVQKGFYFPSFLSVKNTRKQDGSVLGINRQQRLAKHIRRELKPRKGNCVKSAAYLSINRLC